MLSFSGIIRDEGDQSGVESILKMLRVTNSGATSPTDDCVVERAGFITSGWIAKTASKCAPVWNEARTICLLLSGEEFSHGTFDVSRLIRSYEQQGSDFFLRLNGWFYGVLIDLRHDTVTLFNDRYGLNRLYFHEANEGFYFAAEAKSLLTIFPHLRKIDQRGLAEFFSTGCVLQNRSLFPGISVLPGGSQWTFHRNGRIEKKRYFDPITWEQQATLGPSAYLERLKEVFARIAPIYLRSDLPVGISLTGGLDSRMILAWSKANPGDLPCYSFGGPYRDCADVKIARELAKVCHQPHTTLHIENEFFRDFSKLAEETVRISDGTMDISGAVELYLNRKAAAIAPIRLTGNYGSEILRSNVAFRPRILNTEYFTPEFNLHLEHAKETYQSEATGHRLSFIAFKQVAWHHYARYSIERSQVKLRCPFLDNELVALVYQAPPFLATSPQPSLELIAAGNPALDKIPTDRMLQRGNSSLSSRLKNQWQEFTAKAEYAYDYGMPHWLVKADHAMAPLHLEKLFLGRHKFYHFRIWYRDQLSGYLREALNSASNPSCYRDDAPEQIIRSHLSGRSNHTLELHKLFTIRLIEHLFI